MDLYALFYSFIKSQPYARNIMAIIYVSVQCGELERAKDELVAASEPAGSPEDSSVHLSLWSECRVRGGALRRSGAGNTAVS